MAEMTLRMGETPAGRPLATLNDAAWSMATPKLYQENPFRVLGLSVLASPREVNRRLDQLKLGLELGTASFDWAFAPVLPPNLEALRASAQLIKDPRNRFFAEIFWFWAESFPEEGGDDAMDDLERCLPNDAISRWVTGAKSHGLVALHNLAVYHHLIAIEQEQSNPTLADDDVNTWWRAAIGYWKVIQESDEFWDRLRKRVLKLGDAQLPVDSVDGLRRDFFLLLANINAALALKAAESNDTERAARHLTLIGEIFPDGENARRCLEKGLAPVIARVEARIAEMKRSVSGDATRPLLAAQNLIEHCLPDIQVLDTLSGRESALFSEISSRLVAAALDVVVAHQRSTGENLRCLAILIVLQTWAASPETRRRLDETFQVIYKNSLELPERAEEGEEPAYARALRVITGTIIPALDQWSLGSTARNACGEHVAMLLRQVAHDAVREREDIDFALYAFGVLVGLPADSAEVLRREGERDRFHQQFLADKKHELELSLGEHVLEISIQHLRWDDVVLPWTEITALRYGTVEQPNDPGKRQTYVVGWCSATREVALDDANTFSHCNSADESFQRIIDALYHFLVPKLIDRLVAGIQSGDVVHVGNAALQRSGMVIAKQSRLWRKTEEIPYKRLAHRLENSACVVMSADNPKVQERYPTTDTWNAAIMGYVIDALARTA
jgi:hypothetical protein